MSNRYTCVICHNEIPHRIAECPYCRNRSAIAEGASPRILAMVFGILVVVFTATGLYTRSFKIEGRNRGQVRFTAAETAMAQERFEDAIGHYRDALLHARDHAGYRLGLTRALLAAERYSEAEQHLGALRVADPTSGLINHLLARQAAREWRVEEAIAYYRTAIHGRWDDDAETTRLQLRLDFVDLLDRTGRHQLAGAEALEVAQLHPQRPEDRHRLGNVLLKAGLYDRAAEVFRSLAAASSEDRAAVVGWAESELRMGNFEASLEHFTAAEQMRSDARTGRRVALSRRVLELDPSATGLDISERLHRSEVLAQRATAILEACRNPLRISPAGPSTPLPETRATSDSGPAEPGTNGAPGIGAAAVSDNLRRARDAWSVARGLCGPTLAADEPLEYLLGGPVP